MATVTNKILSERMEISHAKVKRYARELLPEDPRARARSGYTRELRLNEAFTIFLGNFLIGELAFSSSEAKAILGELWPWLEKKGLSPESKKEDPIIKRWEVEITPWAEGGFQYIGRGLLVDRVRRQTKVPKTIRVQESFDEYINPPKVGERRTSYLFRNRILPISLLLNIFLLKMGLLEIRGPEIGK